MYCEFEGQDFPLVEFTQDRRYGLIHNREPRHTVSGDLVHNGGNGDSGPLPEEGPGPLPPPPQRPG
jgi:hypothetical protein